MSFKEWIDLLLNVDTDASSGSFIAGWDTTVTNRMARVKFLQAVLLAANRRAGILKDKGFVWTSGSFLPIFDTQSDLRCYSCPVWNFFNSLCDFCCSPSSAALSLSLYGDLDQVSQLVLGGVSVHTANSRRVKHHFTPILRCPCIFHLCSRLTAAKTPFFTWQPGAGTRPWCKL
jgi:hypothetical protein